MLNTVFGKVYCDLLSPRIWVYQKADINLIAAVGIISEICKIINSY